MAANIAYEFRGVKPVRPDRSRYQTRQADRIKRPGEPGGRFTLKNSDHSETAESPGVAYEKTLERRLKDDQQQLRTSDKRSVK